MFKKLLENYLQANEEFQRKAEVLTVMVFAMRDGDLDKAVTLRPQLGKHIEIVRSANAFRELVKKCVGDKLLTKNGETAEEIIIKGKSIGGNDMDFSAELARLDESEDIDT